MVWTFPKAMNDIGSNIAKHYETASKKVTEVMGDPNATMADYQEALEVVDREFLAACSETGTTASNAARKEFERHILKGLDPQAVERWFEQKARLVKNLAEKARPVVPKAWTAAKAAWVAVSAAALAGVAAIGAYVGDTPVQRQPVGPPPPDPVTHPDIIIPPPIPTPPIQSDLATTAGEMDRAFAMFGVPTLDEMGRERVELDVSDLPPPPPAIAAASAAPLWVTARQGDEAHTRTTTVGQVYQALPEDARAQFEEQVRTSISDDHSIHFRDFTVTSPIGSISISSN